MFLRVSSQSDRITSKFMTDSNYSCLKGELASGHLLKVPFGKLHRKIQKINLAPPNLPRGKKDLEDVSAEIYVQYYWGSVIH